MTWDNIFKAAEDSACGDYALKVKDEARWQVRSLALEFGAPDLEDSECPEDEIERYCTTLQVRFDDRGNVTSIKLPNEIARIVRYY